MHPMDVIGVRPQALRHASEDGWSSKWMLTTSIYSIYVYVYINLSLFISSRSTKTKEDNIMLI